MAKEEAPPDEDESDPMATESLDSELHMWEERAAKYRKKWCHAEKQVWRLVHLLEERVAAREKRDAAPIDGDARGDESSGEVPSLVEGG